VGSKIHICTIAARNYLCQVKVLWSSLQEHWPEAHFYCLVADAPDRNSLQDIKVDFDILAISEIGLPNSNAFAFRYSIVEFCTAVKPWLLQHLLSQHSPQGVVYFDPDIMLFSRPVEVIEKLANSTILLTPHLLNPESDRNDFMEQQILFHGTYNLGFIALANNKKSLQFLNWWSKRLINYCLAEVLHGYYVDQKWVDLAVPCFETISILRHAGYNVAWWNLHERILTKDCNEKYQANGEALRFFHFSGFNPSSPSMLSKHRWPVSHTAIVSEIFQDYLIRFNSEEFQAQQKIKYRFNYFTNDQEITPYMRMRYRENEQSFLGINPFNSDGEKSFYRKVYAGNLVHSGILKVVSVLRDSYFGNFIKPVLKRLMSLVSNL